MHFQNKDSHETNELLSLQAVFMAAFYSVLISEVYVCLEMVRLSELHKSVDSLVQVHLVMIHF